MTNLEMVKKAIDELFSNTSVSLEITKKELWELLDEITMRIEAIDPDIKW